MKRRRVTQMMTEDSRVRDGMKVSRIHEREVAEVMTGKREAELMG